MMKLGTCKLDITPDQPVPLAGFAHREGSMDNVFAPVSIRTFICKTEKTSVLWIIGDFIWWDEDDVMNWKTEIAQRFQLPSECIVFHATHNHSGPQLSNRFSKLLGIRNEAYLEKVYKAVMQSVEESMANTTYVTCKVYKGTSTIGVFRRKMVDSVIEMAPNREVEVDDELKVIAFIDQSGRNRAMLISFACHPTVTDANELSGEFPGYVCSKLEEVFPGCTTAFLQGFSGDIRPNLTKNEEFFKGDISAIKKTGDALYQDILAAMENSCDVFTVEKIRVVEEEYSLSFQQDTNYPPIPEGLEDESLKLQDEISDYKLRFQLLTFHEQMQFFTANAEMVQAYGKYLKSLDSRIIPVGYSNGMIGYIPTYSQLLEGGYEAEASLYYFGYPHKVALVTESQLHKLWQNMIHGE